MPDGSIVFDTRIDNSQAAKDLQKLEKKIQETEKTIEGLTSQKKAAQKESMFKAAELDQEKASLQEIKDRLQEIRAMSKDKTLDAGTREAYKDMIPGVQMELQDQQERVRVLQSEYNKVYDSVDRYDQKLQEANLSLDNQKINAQMLTEEIQEANSPMARFGQRVRDAGKGVETLESRIKRLASRVLIFSVITRGLRAVRSWFADVIKSDKEASQQIAKFKGALLTLAQPLVSVVIPAFTTFLRVLTQVIASLATLLSSLMGTTVEESAKAAEALNDEKKALGEVGKEAKKATKPLANFDEINRLSFGDDSGAAGGAAADASALAPDFSFLDDADEKIRKIADGVMLVGSLLAMWKITGFLGQLAEAIPALGKFVDPLKTIQTVLLGIALAIAGIILFVNSLKDAWENGVDWGNAVGLVAGLALAVIGLYLAFKVLNPALAPIVAGIVLVVGGIALMITAFKDAAENGWNLQNTFLAIAGILATGLGISILVCSWIPLIIAAIASVLLALTIATGHGDELIAGIKQTLQGFKDFFVGIFTGDIKKALGGLDQIFHGLETSVDAVVDGIRDTLLAFLDWLDEKTGGKLSGIIGHVKQLIFDAFDTLKAFLGSRLTALKEIFSGVVEFLSGIFSQDFDAALHGILRIAYGFVGRMLSPFLTLSNRIIDIINAIFDVINRASEFFGKSLNLPHFEHIKLPDFPKSDVPELSKSDIPAIAKGTVTPTNREFMEASESRNRGYSSEAKEDAILSAIQELGQLYAGQGDTKIVFQGDLAALARAMNPYIEREKDRVGTSFVNIGARALQ